MERENEELEIQPLEAAEEEMEKIMDAEESGQMEIVDADEVTPQADTVEPTTTFEAAEAQADAATEAKPAKEETTDSDIIDAPPPDTSMVGMRMDTEARWYVLHTFSGYEAVAEDNLKMVIEKYSLTDRVFEIFIPTEDAVVEKREKKVLVSQKTMPSYIFIKMIYGDDLWHTITRTRGITGFVGPKGRPLPLTSKEVIAMKLERRVNASVKLEVKDTIQIIDGPLAGQTAVVTAVDAATNKCTATVSMFGRPTSVELYTTQIKKLG